MEPQTTTNSTCRTVSHNPASELEPAITAAQRGGEAKSIGQLMKPVEKIMRHPDRNRLLADFFKRYW